MEEHYPNGLLLAITRYRKFQRPFPLTPSVPLVPPSCPPAGVLAQGVPVSPRATAHLPHSAPSGWPCPLPAARRLQDGCRPRQAWGWEPSRSPRPAALRRAQAGRAAARDGCKRADSGSRPL